MSNNLYFSMIALKRKYVVLLVAQLLFLSGVGYGVYTYDQLYPDQQVDNAVYAPTTTTDQIVHWLSIDRPDMTRENKPNLAETKIPYIVNSMNLDNEITSITLFERQNSRESQVFKTLSYGSDLLVILNTPELTQFPVIFKISNQFSNPVVEMSVVQLPNQTGFIDVIVDNQGDLLFSSVDLYLWGLWYDLISDSVSHDQFISLLPQQYINSSTYLSEIGIDDLNWESISDEVPVNVDEWLVPIYELPEWSNPVDINQSVNIKSNHRELATHLDRISSNQQNQIADLVNDVIATPSRSHKLAQIPGLYLLIALTIDDADRIHGQGLSVTTTQNLIQIHTTDYYVIDPDGTDGKDTSMWSWDLRDNPGITYVFDKVPTHRVSDTIYYLNTDTNLDIRLRDVYEQITATNNEFLAWYYNDARRDRIQLGWFDPTDPSAKTNLTQGVQFSNQPQNWIDVAERNAVPEFNTYEVEDIERNFQNPFVPYRSVISQLLSYSSDDSTHLHFAFQDVPKRYDGNWDAMALYSWDLDLAELDPDSDFAGEITTLREPEGSVDNSFLVKNGYLESVAMRENGGNMEFLYFYRNYFTIQVNTRHFVMIVQSGGSTDE